VPQVSVRVKVGVTESNRWRLRVIGSVQFLIMLVVAGGRRTGILQPLRQPANGN
jgi:CHASE2 domain-containing sensor protein